MYCTKCGTSFEGNCCPSCGQPAVKLNEQQPPIYQTTPIYQAPPIQGGCPKCGSQNVQVTTETTAHTKGFGLGKGCLGWLIFGWFGWLCGLCGMGKGKTTSNTFRVCGNCGHRFK